MRRVVAVGVCVAVLGGVAGAQEPAQEDPPPGLVPAAAYFPSELIDWAELYANPVLEIEPVGFGAVAFERRSFERSVASLVLIAASTCGLYVGLRSGLQGGRLGARGGRRRAFRDRRDGRRPGVHPVVAGPRGPPRGVVAVEAR